MDQEAHGMVTKNRERDVGAGRSVDGEMTSHRTQATLGLYCRLAQNRHKWQNHEEAYLQQAKHFNIYNFDT